MKTTFWKMTVWCGGFTAAVVVAGAGTLQRGDIIADPAWVLHVDCAAMKQTALGKALLAELDQPDAQKKFAAIQAVFNVDPRKDLHGVTIYGATKAPADGVVVAYADFDPERLVTLIEANPDYQSTKHGAHTIHSWIDEKAKAQDGVKPRSYGAIYKGKVIIIGQKDSRIAEALDVMSKSKPNLTSSTQFARLGANGQGGFIIGAARKLDLPGNDPAAAVFKQAKTFWLNVREAQDRTEVNLNLEAEDAEVAKQMGDVSRGLVALLSLQTEKPEAVKLGQGITISQEEKTVTAKLSLPSNDVVGMIKAQSAQKRAND